MGYGMEGSKHIETLAVSRRTDTQARQTPEIAYKRREDPVDRVHKKDRTVAYVCFL